MTEDRFSFYKIWYAYIPTLLSRQQLAYLDFLSSKMAVREAEAAATNPVVE